MSNTKLQLFDLCVQLLAENDAADSRHEEWVKKGIMTNHDACVSFIYNYFTKNRLDPERRSTLKTTLVSYALANTWLQGDFRDHCHDNNLSTLTFEEFLNGYFLASERYDISEATGNNGSKDIQIGTLCLLREMLSLLSVDPAATTPNPDLNLRDSTPDPNALLRPWGA
jgi:hypothetical protein